MLVAAMLTAAVFVRSAASVWPPDDVPTLQLSRPSLAMVLLLASSAVLTIANRGGARVFHFVAVALGAGFLALHGACAAMLWNSGLTLSAGGSYATAVYGLGLVHALLAAPGWVALGTASVRRLRETSAAFWSDYWHFVTGVWCLFFLALFGL